MWSINNKMKSYSLQRLALWFMILGLVAKSVQITYEDEDTIIIEDVEMRATEGARWTFARQWPGFGQGWPLGIGGGIGGGGFPQLPSLLPPGGGGQKPGHCYTRTGFEGECRQAKQCYPSLYNAQAYTAEERSADLVEFYQASGCINPVLSNHLYFSADAELRQSMVCCKKPTVPWPGAISQHTTTKSPYVFTRPTTFSPFNKRNMTMYPYPPQHIQGGPGGHRPPTPRPTGRPWPPAAPTARPTTTTATTARTTMRPWWETQPTTTTTTTQAPWWSQTQPTRMTTKTPVAAPQRCGVSRIVGGSPPVRGSYPWMASIYWNGRHDCGGSLIDSTHILTAGHCVVKYTHTGGLTVLLGAHNRGVSEDGRISRRVIRIMRHGQFSNTHPIQNDIAMLTLDSPVDISPRVSAIKPICLPSPNMNYDTGSTSGWVSGWGGTAQNRPPVNTMLHVRLRVLTNQDCSAQYRRLGHGGITPTVFCAGNPGQDACQGDSGGPFIIKDSDTSPAVQIGIVSWGIGCGVGPGVYTRVEKYLPWIEKNRTIR